MPSPALFRDDDAGYLAWLVAHSEGYVLNIARSYSATDARMHHAGCWTISGRNARASTLTGSYIKVCARSVTALQEWAVAEVGREIPSCGTCRPTIPITEPTTAAKAHQAAEHVDGARTGGVPPAADVASRPEDAAAPTVEGQGHFTIGGPTLDSHVVEAWSSNYIFDGRRPAWLEDLRDEIRSRCNELTPAADQVLHAMYFGTKHSTADVENLLFYNVGTFKIAGGNGIRFEHGASVSRAPDGTGYPYAYRYALEHPDSEFQDWRPGRELASFGWVNIGEPNKTPTLAQIWLALSRNPGRTYGPARAPNMPFALRLKVRPPRGQHPVWGGLVKRIFDGAICAYQAHTDTAVLPIVAERIAAALGEEPQEIASLLLDQRHAVLGAVPQLAKPYGKNWETGTAAAGVQWNPSDELCEAGELLPDTTDEQRLTEAPHWSIKGQLIELFRSQ
ncbi:hypothetical protein BH10ACT9_BH10ACT9_41250 [soil metagenome]